MGRFLRKIKKIGEKVVGEDAVNRVEEQVTSVVSNQWNGVVSDPNLLSKLQSTSNDVHKHAKATIDICQETQEQRTALVDFCGQIQSTMKGLGDDPSVLTTIRDLTDGKRLAEAMKLAQTAQVSATKCVETSIQMIDSLEDGLDKLPDVIKKGLDQWTRENDNNNDDINDDGDDDDMAASRSVEQDIRDVEECIDSIHKLDLGNCLLVGFRAFESLSAKSQRSREMFDVIRNFATNVDDTMKAFRNMQITQIKDKIQDFWKCLQMTSEMKVLALAAGKLLSIIIRLFESTAERISQLWAALAFAKDCVEECVDEVQQAKDRCLQARNQSVLLMERSLALKDQVQRSSKAVSPDSVRALKELSDGQEIRELVTMAQSMDNYAMECSSKVIGMVQKVSEGFNSMPSILTLGVDLENDGFREEDEKPHDIEPDIQDLVASRQAIEEADVFGAAKAAVQGFSTLNGKAELCRGTLDSVTQFSTSVDSVLSSFIQVWDLEVAYTKIKEMCRIVSLGDLMKRFVSQIKEFALAMIALLKCTLKKLSSLDVKMIANDTAGRVTSQISSTVNKVEGKMDDLKNRFKDKLPWK